MSYQKLPKIDRPIKSVAYDTTNLRNLVSDKSQQEIILQAIKIGYLVYPSKEFLWKVFRNQDDIVDKGEEEDSVKFEKFSSFLNGLNRIKFLNLQNIPIFEIGDLDLCYNIKILNLSSNYLINIEPLAVCKQLMRLDLQKNQLKELPGGEFWLGLSNLKILYLHNNQISQIENLKFLKYSQKLEILTLFDTPVSLKKNYRHHVVNSIATLKVIEFCSLWNSFKEKKKPQICKF